MLQFLTVSNDLLPPSDPVSQTVRAGDFLFVSGQLASAPHIAESDRGEVSEQTQRVMDSLKFVLDQAGVGFDRVVMARLFLTDLQDYQSVNQVFSTYFNEKSRPSRTTIGVLDPADQGDIEIDLVVYCGE
jgi:2-iminobutanoate/2-iminopropanoate deaminase